MISYTVYKVIHYIGIFGAVGALVALLARIGLIEASPGATDPWRRRLVALHGTGLFLVLLGGFGMLARLEITHGLGLPGWIWAKLVLWGGLAIFVTVGKRAPQLAGWLTLLAPIFAILAGTIAHTKPF